MQRAEGSTQIHIPQPAPHATADQTGEAHPTTSPVAPYFRALFQRGTHHHKHSNAIRKAKFQANLHALPLLSACGSGGALTHRPKLDGQRRAFNRCISGRFLPPTGGTSGTLILVRCTHGAPIETGYRSARYRAGGRKPRAPRGPDALNASLNPPEFTRVQFCQEPGRGLLECLLCVRALPHGDYRNQRDESCAPRGVSNPTPEVTILA